MIADRLEVSNLRLFENQEFELSSWMNVFIGENGAGKSTILDGLRYNLSRVMPRIAKANRGYVNADKNDVRVGANKLSVELDLRADYVEFTHKVLYDGDTWKRKWNPSDNSVEESIQQRGGGVASQPLAIHFSPRRSILTGSTGSTSAYQGALAMRGLNINSFKDWWESRVQLTKEGSRQAAMQAEELRNSVSRFLEGRYELEGIEENDPNSEDDPRLIVSREGTPLNILQLSDGEQGVLSLVLDITKRLTQANPELDSPTQDAEAIILIDELSLHIHPNWQRYIVGRLKKTFPKCQFICTTHSPFIVQALDEKDKLHSLDNYAPIQQIQNRGIETISSGLMGVEDPDRSPLYQEMVDSAKNYLLTLEEMEAEPEAKLEEYKEMLAEEKEPYADNPAYQAFLELKKAGKIEG